MDITQYLSEIDTLRFGIPVARITGVDFPLETLIPKLKQSQVKLVIWRVNCSEISQINQLERLGFEYKDMQATYRYDISGGQDTVISRKVNIRSAVPGDEHALMEIAGEAFLHYGHYAANSRLPVESSCMAYVDWVKRSVCEHGVADQVLIAEVRGEVAGFLSLTIVQQGTIRFGKGVVGAVSAVHRKNGLLKTLAEHGILWSREENLAWVEHNVQVSNYAAARSLTNAGFRIGNAFMTLHLWID